MITLVLGGARSGKSAFAEQLAGSSGTAVNYLATAIVGDDPDFAVRVAAHRARRPLAWKTVEAGADLSGALDSIVAGETVLIESLGTWVAATPEFEVDIDRLVASLVARTGLSIVVSEEVGLGVHPSTEVGGRFRDRLGSVNQAVSAVAGKAYLVVAGRSLLLGPLSIGAESGGQG